MNLIDSISLRREVAPKPTSLSNVLVTIVGVATLLPWVPAALALFVGIGLALTVGNPRPEMTRGLARRALAGAVVGLGAGMDLGVIGRVGLHGLGYTAIGIGGALLLGAFLGRRLGVGRDSALLVSVGTAICGGSAIAAVARSMRARDADVSMALATVFLLNAVALIVFPFVGHAVGLDQHAFGLWCALAIHDTSSVVGAAAQYGEQALEVATAGKLARALWIIPVTFVIAVARARARSEESSMARTEIPWFIAGFVAVAALFTFVPALRPASSVVSAVAHRALAASLFLIGLGLTRETIASLGFRPFLQGALLWICLASGSLGAILLGIIR